MARRKHAKVIGKGLKALIKENGAGGKLRDREREAKTKEFYGSLLKKYVQIGSDDPLIEQMMTETKEHLGISEEEHNHLLKTLSKREHGHPTPKTDMETVKEVQEDLKIELEQLFDEFKEEIKRGYEESPSKSPKKVSIEDYEKEAIPLPERTVTIVEDDEQEEELKEEEKIEDMIQLPQAMVKEVTGRGEEVISAPPSSGPEPPSNPPELVKERHDIIRIGAPPKMEDMGLGEIKEIEELEKEKIIGDGEFGEEPDEMENIPEAIEEEVKEEPEEEEALEEIGPEDEEAPYVSDSLLSLKTLMEEDRIDDALEMSQRLLGAEPDNVQVLNERGVLLYHINDYRGALDCYSKALEIKPDSLEIMINYAVILAGTGEIDEAMNILDHAVEKDPYYEEAWHNKAVVLTHAGRYREAIKCLDHSLRINEKSLETWLNKAIILEKLGDNGPACDSYRRALDLDPENDTALKGLSECERSMNT